MVCFIKPKDNSTKDILNCILKRHLYAIYIALLITFNLVV